MERFEVVPSALLDAVVPFEAAMSVAREVAGRRGELLAEAAATGVPGVAEAAEDFLQAWSLGLALVAGEGDRIGRALRAVAANYTVTEAHAARVDRGPR